MNFIVNSVSLRAFNKDMTEEVQQATCRIQTAKELHNELKADRQYAMTDQLERQIAIVTERFKRQLEAGKSAVCETDGSQPSNALVQGNLILMISSLKERLKHQKRVNKLQEKRLLNLEKEFERLCAIQVLNQDCHMDKQFHAKTQHYLQII
ncbi:hypothetical protein M3Y96_00308100 [Aphelenchoides besseyi]|nr:hypothetical protein M3Y96_00308100 [Aphelenchoides besseyi]